MPEVINLKDIHDGRDPSQGIKLRKSLKIRSSSWDSYHDYKRWVRKSPDRHDLEALLQGLI
jgi:hypothetical protein